MRPEQQPKRVEQWIERLEKVQNLFIVLPYVSHKAESYFEKLKGLVNKYYPKIDVNFAF